MKRPNWDDYYMNIAEAVSLRGECRRRQIGAIIVKHHAIVGEGYNGAPPGEKSCLEGACPRATSDAPPDKNYAESGCHVIHAETNALLRTSWGNMNGATMYVTAQPCNDCWPKIRATGLSFVIYKNVDGNLVQKSLRKNTKPIITPV